MKGTKRILGVICLFVLCALLVAALWPFTPVPLNEVSWLADENGLRFGERATILGSGVFSDVSRLSNEAFCSLEIWLQPAFGSVKSSETILAFYAPDNPRKFRLMQYRDQFLVQRDYQDQYNRRETAEIKIEHAFHKDERVLFTVTANLKGTSVYTDSKFAESSSRFGLTCSSFSGQLVIGNSPTKYEPWQGKLFGVALYNQGLIPQRVSQHYESWVHRSAPGGFSEDHLLGFYSFGERAGRWVHDSIGTSPDLYIPETFRIPHKGFLTPPWDEFSPDLSYVYDVAANIIGFIPFGFFFYAYMTLDRPWDRAAGLTIAVGGLTSFTIEILQAFLPSRSSGVTDIIANTLGSGLGVILWKWQGVQNLVARLTGSKCVR